METISFVLAQLFAVVYFTAGLGILIGPKHYEQMAEDFFDNKGLVFITGFFTLVLSYLILAVHNVWAYDWRVLITVFGCLGLVKGFFLICFPRLMQAFVRYYLTIDKALIYDGIIALIFGVFFGVVGWL